jgi:hypothetical protein
LTVRLGFSDEQVQLRGAVREMLGRACPPARVRAAWSDDAVRRGLWDALAGIGLTSLTVPEHHGGMGLGEVDLVLPLEECGRAALPGPLVETIAAGAPLLHDLGIPGEPIGPDGPVESDRWLRRVAAGEAILALGLEAAGGPGAPWLVDADLADLFLLEHGGELHVLARDAVRLIAQPSVDGARRGACSASSGAPRRRRAPRAPTRRGRRWRWPSTGRRSGRRRSSSGWANAWSR